MFLVHMFGLQEYRRTLGVKYEIQNPYNTRHRNKNTIKEDRKADSKKVGKETGTGINLAGQIEINYTCLMSTTQLEITPEGGISIHGPLPGLQAHEAKNLTALLKKLIHKLNETKNVYKRLLEDDGKLIGQERFILVQSMDESLAYLVLLRAILENKNEFSAINIKYNYKLHIKIKGKSWQGQGLLGIYRKLNFKEFDVWLSRILKDRMVKIIQFYSGALSDGVLDSRERIILNRSLDRLIFSVILVRENIISGKID